MPIAINGSGTITGISTGGLPDGCIATDDLANNAVTTANLANNAVTTAKLGTNEASGLCKAWVNFNGTGTVAIRASYNVSSITDNGVGNYTVNFTTAMVDANYAACSNSGTAGGTGQGAWTVPYSVATTTAANVRISGSNSAGTVQDQDQVMIAIFR